MEYVDPESLFAGSDGDDFRLFSNKEENLKFYNTINDLVISTSDKYPRNIESHMGFSKTYVARKNSKLTNNNIVRLLDKETKTKVLAQYSYHTSGLMTKEDIQSIKNNECTIYMICHTDMDGDASGSLVFNTLRYGDNIKITRFNYNYDTLEQLILKANVDKAQNPGKKFIMFIVDLSPNLLAMVKLLSTFNKIIWIDHHAGSILTANDLESGSFIQSLKSSCITSDFSYVLDTRMSATQLALLWMTPYVFDLKRFECIEGYTLASLISIYDMKMDKRFPEVYNKAVCLNQYYWDYQTLYVFTTFWKDAFTKEYENSVISNMLTCGKRLWDLNQEKLNLLYDYDYKYIYKITYPNGKTLTIRGIYGTGNNARFKPRDNHAEGDYEITLLIKYTNIPAILQASGYSDDALVKEMGINNVFGIFGLGQGHPGAAGMRISREDMLKLGTNSILRVSNPEDLPYLEIHTEYDNRKIEIGLKQFKNKENIQLLDDFKDQIRKQYLDSVKKHSSRFDHEIDLMVRLFTLIFAITFSRKCNNL